MKGQIVGFVLAWCVAQPAVSDEPKTAEVRAAGMTFLKTCASCHQVPDRRFETDRAWLGQLSRTA